MWQKEWPPWELRNVIERLLLFPEDPRQALELPPEQAVSLESYLDLPYHEGRKKWMTQFDRSYLQHMLDRCEGIVTQAAQRAPIPRQSFHRLLRKYRLAR
jgi:transcriptional regulator of acetoin/glycerol metabolism